MAPTTPTATVGRTVRRAAPQRAAERIGQAGAEEDAARATGLDGAVVCSTAVGYSPCLRAARRHNFCDLYVVDVMRACSRMGAGLELPASVL
jgi:hypothetical protein